MDYLIDFWGDFFTAAVFLFLIPISFLGLILPSTLTISNLAIAWLRENRRKILIFLTVILSCSLLGCLIYSWAASRPTEEPRIAAQTSEIKTSGKNSEKTGDGWDFPPPEGGDGYIGNTSTKKFHEPSCSYLPDSSNRTYFDTRDEALDAGYSPCRRCYP